MADDEKSAGEVGYCRPPKQHQFKPGHSGNRKGRRKRPPTTYSILSKILEERVQITLDGKRKRVTKQEARFLALFAKAAAGNLRASAEIERQMLLFAPELAKRARQKNEQTPEQMQAVAEALGREIAEIMNQGASEMSPDDAEPSKQQ